MAYMATVIWNRYDIKLLPCSVDPKRKAHESQKVGKQARGRWPLQVGADEHQDIEQGLKVMRRTMQYTCAFQEKFNSHERGHPLAENKDAKMI